MGDDVEDVKVDTIGAAVLGRAAGAWLSLPGWAAFVYDPALFASMSDDGLAEDGWP